MLRRRVGRLGDSMHWIPIRFAFFGDTRTVYDKWQHGGNIADNVRVLNTMFARMNVWFYVDETPTYNGDNETVAARDINLCPADNLTDCPFFNRLMPTVANDTPPGDRRRRVQRA
ncbi:MAG: hypothetical protein GY700_12050 [Propionibacteriaceae bacterium]|nr:hypothetical protein [Propionibacteriaceae bacterium]